MSRFDYINSRSNWNVPRTPMRAGVGVNNSLFTDTFPLNLLNKGKIRMEYTFVVPNKIEELQPLDLTKDTDYDDIPELVDDTPQTDNSSEESEDVENSEEAEEESGDSEESEESERSRDEENSNDSSESSDEEIKTESDNIVNTTLKKIYDVQNEINNVVNVFKNTMSSASTKGGFLGFFEGDVGFTTPEDRVYIDNYRRTHSDALIYEVLANATSAVDRAVASAMSAVQAVTSSVASTTSSTSIPEVVNYVSEHPVKITTDGHIETDVSISGENFNIIYQGVPLVKLTNESCNHNGFQFVEGENVDCNDFKYDASCGPDGIYFCTLDDAHNWFDYSSSPMVYMWDVTIPNNAKTAMYSKKLKSDRVILSNKRKIIDYVINKLVGMVSNDVEVDAIFRYIKNLPSHLRKSEQMEEVYLTLLTRDVSLFERIPEECRSYNLCLFVAKNDKSGYSKLKDECVSYEILMECVKTNIDTYAEIPEESRTVEMSQFAFEQDHSVYACMPDSHKTVENTVRYLDSTEDADTDSIPAEFMNTPEVMNRVLQRDGNRLEDVDYKNKTYDICLTAVRTTPEAIEHVPITFLDENICSQAIENDPHIWDYIPNNMRSVELKEKAVVAFPDHFQLFDVAESEMTHKMMCALIEGGFFECINFDSEDSNIVTLLEQNAKTYLDLNSDVVIELPDRYISDELALEIVRKDHEMFDAFNEARSFQFTVDCVKAGVDFCEIDESMVTIDLLIELVTARQSVIDELPERFIFDDLYIICMKVHGMRLDDIPSRFFTEKVVRVGMELHPEDRLLTEDSIIVDNTSNVQQERSSPKPIPPVSSTEISVDDLICA